MAVAAALAGRRVNDRLDDAAQLVAGLGRGDRVALDRLYARYGRALFAYVSDLVPDAGMAEEVVQDTFVAAWRGAARFEHRSSVASWLFGIARRQARDRTRSRGPELAPPQELEELITGDRGPEAHALASAARADLISALDRLPSHHREPLVLALVHGLSGPEIAAVLGVPEGTVKSRLHAARRSVRALLDKGDLR